MTDPIDPIDSLRHQTALDFLLNRLKPDAAAAFRADLEGDANLRAHVAGLGEVFAALAADLPPLQPPAELKARIFKKLPARVPPAIQSGPLAPVQSGAVVVPLNRMDFQPTPFPGVDVYIVRRDDALGSSAVFFRVQPGCSYPDHKHNGWEDCIVLRGRIRDEHAVYEAGTFINFGAGSDHRGLVALEGEPAIVYIANQGGVEY